jgi:hypothetical protein
MRRRLGLTALAVASLLGLGGQVQAATSTSTVGNTTVPNTTTCGGRTYLQISTSSGNPASVQTAGTITSWRLQTGGTVPTGAKLKVARPVVGGFIIVGEAPTTGTIATNAVNQFPADIAVQPGDVIGIYGGTTDYPCVNNSGTGADGFALYNSEPPVSSGAQPPNAYGSTFRLPVEATVTTTTPDSAGPSNQITVGKPFLNPGDGTAMIPTSVPGPGKLTLTGSGVVTQRPARASASREVSQAELVDLLVKAKGKAKKKLLAKGKVKVKATITFTPNGGSPGARAVSVVLKKK